MLLIERAPPDVVLSTSTSVSRTGLDPIPELLTKSAAKNTRSDGRARYGRLGGCSPRRRARRRRRGGRSHGAAAGDRAGAPPRAVSRPARSSSGCLRRYAQPVAARVVPWKRKNSEPDRARARHRAEPDSPPAASSHGSGRVASDFEARTLRNHLSSIYEELGVSAT